MVQWLFGFMSFWHRGEVRTTRLKVLPWHVFLGLYTYGLAVVTAETGLLEKLTFLQTLGNVSRRCPETTVVNGLGLGLALLSSLVIVAALTPKHHSSHWKTVVTFVHICECFSTCFCVIKQTIISKLSLLDVADIPLSIMHFLIELYDFCINIVKGFFCDDGNLQPSMIMIKFCSKFINS